jgi:hypothetical protein
LVCTHKNIPGFKTITVNNLSCIKKKFLGDETIDIDPAYDLQKEYDAIYAIAELDAAKKIFEEIERLTLNKKIGGIYPAKIINPVKYAALREKYTEGTKDGKTH